MLTWRQTFNEAPSVAGIIIFVLQKAPSLLVINAGGVFPARRITISNPSPDPARRSVGVVQNVLLCLGLNIDHDVMGRRNKTKSWEGERHTCGSRAGEAACTCCLPAPTRSRHAWEGEAHPTAAARALGRAVCIKDLPYGKCPPQQTCSAWAARGSRRVLGSQRLFSTLF